MSQMKINENVVIYKQNTCLKELFLVDTSEHPFIQLKAT